MINEATNPSMFKVLRVIESCNNLEQLQIAERYVKLAVKTFVEIQVVFVYLHLSIKYEKLSFT